MYRFEIKETVQKKNYNQIKFNYARDTSSFKIRDNKSNKIQFTQNLNTFVKMSEQILLECLLIFSQISQIEKLFASYREFLHCPIENKCQLVQCSFSTLVYTCNWRSF